VRAIDPELPLEAEIPLDAIVRGMRDDREEQGAGLDLLADRGVPCVPAPQLALVEPNLDSGGSQGLANTDLNSLRRGDAERFGLPYPDIASACKFRSEASTSAEPLPAAVGQRLEAARATACKALMASKRPQAHFVLPVIIARNELAASAERQATVRFLSGLAALFLYVAFFNTLASVTVSVIEAIGLEEVSTTGANAKPMTDHDVSTID
jgi:hypothetical protein